MFPNHDSSTEDGVALNGIALSGLEISGVDGSLRGAAVRNASVTIGDMAGVFHDEAARAALPPETVVYATQVFRPVPDGTGGGLFFGSTVIMPGAVGAEYFMTRGHFHAKRDRAEFYWCLRGEGLLVLMDKDRHWRVEAMRPGSVHHIPAFTAHRTVNTGREALSFSACWPSDAGHDYAAIARAGFSVRVFRVNGIPEVVEVTETSEAVG
jgi:glucose-6-phosphate isomerase